MAAVQSFGPFDVIPKKGYVSLRRTIMGPDGPGL